MAQKPSASIPPVVLIAGSEAALRDDARRALRERVLGDAAADFDEDRFDLAEPGGDARRVIGALRTLPVLTPRRWVELRGLADRRAQSFLDGPLRSYLEAPLETAVLVLVAERIDRRQRWVKRALEIGEWIDCSAPRRAADLSRWIEARVARSGKRPGRGMAQRLADAVGADLDALANEVDKLCLYVGERAEIEAEDVELLTGTLRSRAIYELTDLVGRRQPAAALQLLGRLLDQGDAPLALLGALAAHFRRLIRARECQPQTASEVQKQLGVHPYAAEKLLQQTRRFPPARLLRCLSLAQRTDEIVKGALSLPPAAALEQLVLAVAA